MPFGKLHPLSENPSIEKLQARFWLIQRHHMAPGMKSHECQIAATLDLTNLPAVTAKLQGLELDLVVSLLPRPVKSLGPCLVTQPVADEVSVALRFISKPIRSTTWECR